MAKPEERKEQSETDTQRPQQDGGTPSEESARPSETDEAEIRSRTDTTAETKSTPAVEFTSRGPQAIMPFTYQFLETLKILISKNKLQKENEPRLFTLQSELQTLLDAEKSPPTYHEIWDTSAITEISYFLNSRGVLWNYPEADASYRNAKRDIGIEQLLLTCLTEAGENIASQPQEIQTLVAKQKEHAQKNLADAQKCEKQREAAEAKQIADKNAAAEKLHLEQEQEKQKQAAEAEAKQARISRIYQLKPTTLFVEILNAKLKERGSEILKEFITPQGDAHIGLFLDNLLKQKNNRSKEECVFYWLAETSRGDYAARLNAILLPCLIESRKSLTQLEEKASLGTSNLANAVDDLILELQTKAEGTYEARSKPYAYQVIQIILDTLRLHNIETDQLGFIQLNAFRLHGPGFLINQKILLNEVVPWIQSSLTKEQSLENVLHIMRALNAAIEAMEQNKISINPRYKNELIYNSPEARGVVSAFKQLVTLAQKKASDIFSHAAEENTRLRAEIRALEEAIRLEKEQRIQHEKELQISKSPFVKEFLAGFNNYPKTAEAKEDAFESKLTVLAKDLTAALSLCDTLPEPDLSDITKFNFPVEHAYLWAREWRQISRNQKALCIISSYMDALQLTSEKFNKDTPGDFGRQIQAGLAAALIKIQSTDSADYQLLVEKIDVLKIGTKLGAALEIALTRGYAVLDLRKKPLSYQVLKIIIDEFKLSYKKQDDLTKALLGNRDHGLQHWLVLAEKIDMPDKNDNDSLTFMNACKEALSALRSNIALSGNTALVASMITAINKAQEAIKNKEIGFDQNSKELESISQNLQLLPNAIDAIVAQEEKLTAEAEKEFEIDDFFSEAKQVSPAAKEAKEIPEGSKFAVNFLTRWQTFSNTYVPKKYTFKEVGPKRELQKQATYLTSKLSELISGKNDVVYEIQESQFAYVLSHSAHNNDKLTVECLEAFLGNCNIIRDKGKGKAKTLEQGLLQCLEETRGDWQNLAIKSQIENLITRINIATKQGYGELEKRDEKPLAYQILQIICHTMRSFFVSADKDNLNVKLDNELRSAEDSKNKDIDIINKVVDNMKNGIYAYYKDRGTRPTAAQICDAANKAIQALQNDKIGINLSPDAIKPFRELLNTVITENNKFTQRTARQAEIKQSPSNETKEVPPGSKFASVLLQNWKEFNKTYATGFFSQWNDARKNLKLEANKFQTTLQKLLSGEIKPDSYDLYNGWDIRKSPDGMTYQTITEIDKFVTACANIRGVGQKGDELEQGLFDCLQIACSESKVSDRYTQGILEILNDAINHGGYHGHALKEPKKTARAQFHP